MYTYIFINVTASAQVQLRSRPQCARVCFWHKEVTWANGFIYVRRDVNIEPSGGADWCWVRHRAWAFFRCRFRRNRRRIFKTSLNPLSNFFPTSATVLAKLGKERQKKASWAFFFYPPFQYPPFALFRGPVPSLRSSDYRTWPNINITQAFGKTVKMDHPGTKKTCLGECRSLEV